MNREDVGWLGPTTVTPNLFINREQELQLLHQLLIGERRGIVVLSGQPGSGKTSLAREFAYRYLDAFRNVYWSRSSQAKLLELELESASVMWPSAFLRALVVVDEVTANTAPEVLRATGQVTHRAQLLLISRQALPDVKAPVGLVEPLGPQDLNQLVDALIGEDEARRTLHTLMREFPASAPFLPLLIGLVRSRVISHEHISDLLAPLDRSGLLAPDGTPIRSGAAPERAFIQVVSAVDDELLRRLAHQPTEIFSLHPRQFEQVVAELLRRQGYEVRLTPFKGDGGKDIYVAADSTVGSFLYLVECKLWAPDRPVGVAVVRQLYGTVLHENATAGMLVTTSTFTRGAHEFQEAHRFQLSLRDFFAMKAWLRDEAQKSRKS